MPATRHALNLTDRYHAALDTLAGKTGAAAAQLDITEDLGVSLDEVIQRDAVFITVGQTAAMALTRGYFRALARAEIGLDRLTEVVAEPGPGFTGDGRPLAEGLAATRAKTLGGLSRGWSEADAVNFARASLRRFALTETMDASSRELLNLIDVTEGARGWRWRARGTCGACFALDDGSIHTETRSFKRHPHCVCIPEPDFDVAERFARPTGRDRFNAMSIEEQDAVIGSRKAELLRTGAIKWMQLVQVVRHREWTDSLTERSLAEILAVAGLSVQS